MLVHGALKREPILVQTGFLILIANSSDCKFTSHTLTSRCKAATGGANDIISSAYTTIKNVNVSKDVELAYY